VSTVEILDYVWGEGIRRSEQALMALIKRLRRKMDKHGLPNLVETVRGRGLRLSAIILPTSRSNSRISKASIKEQNPSRIATQGVELRKFIGQRT
jgi:DNA-binding winged helix-turn-helix (wHTH) protein